MQFDSILKWTLIALIASIRKVNVQMAYPVFMPPPAPIIAVPPPMPIPVIAIEVPELTTTSTTTTTERSVAIAIPVPVPMPVQVAVPAYAPAYCIVNPRPKSCPPCPPCLCMPQCTPAFYSYCSPCHQKCRCRSPNEAPMPLPPAPPMPIPGPVYPMPVGVPAPPPVMVVPIPPIIQSRQRPRRWRPRPSSSSEETSDSSDCDSSMSRKFKRRRLKVLRKRGSSESDREVVKPLLTYVSNNGDVRYEKKISNDEADQLLGRNDGRRYKTVNVITRKDAANKQQVVVMSDQVGSKRNRQVVLRDGGANHVLSSGKKELVFMPPENKRISNLSVSFQIA